MIGRNLEFMKTNERKEIGTKNKKKSNLESKMLPKKS